jgi:hypothetical protein
LLAILAPVASPLAAQLPGEEAGPLPPEVIQEVVETLNSQDILRLPGGTRIPAGARIEGSVAVLGGGVELQGEITGDLLVANGDLRVRAGASVGGDVLIVGGTIQMDPGATIAGETRVFAFPFRYRTRAGVVEAIPEGDFAPGFFASDLGFGQARLTIRAGPAYNRVEGLPVRIGPVIQTAGSNPLSMEALAIWRSVSGFNLESDRLGYAFLLEQAIGGRGTASVGATAFRDVAAIESRGMGDLESSLSTFLLRRDLRDYYEREGWTTFLDFRPPRIPLNLTLTYREERNTTPVVRDPWTLRSSDLDWRPLTLVGEGTVRSVEADLRWDRTDNPEDPSDGWSLALGFARQVGGALRLPSFSLEPLPPEAEPGPMGPMLPTFTHGSFDMRRYARVSPTSRLSLRVVGTGALTSTPLPPQRQSALGGDGSLPGHPNFSVSCGARSTTHYAVTEEEEDGRGNQEVFPLYGCDRTLLFQAEFQGFLPLSWNPVPDDWEDAELSSLFELRPAWEVFFNVGRGWARGELVEGVPRSDSLTRADVGFGLFFGPLGLYWAYPLNRRDQKLNFFVRLERRF